MLRPIIHFLFLAMAVAVAACQTTGPQVTKAADRGPAMNQAANSQDRPVAGQEEVAEPPVVLVLPFRPLANDQKNAWVGQALQQHLQAELGRVRGLRMAGTITIRKEIAPTTQPGAAAIEDNWARQMAREVDADIVVFGTYHVVDTTVRVSGQVVEVESGKELGFLKADGMLRRLLSLEDALAEQAREALGVRVAEAEDQGEPQTEPQTQPQTPAVAEREVVEQEEMAPIQEGPTVYYPPPAIESYSDLYAGTAYPYDSYVYPSYVYPSYVYTPYDYGAFYGYPYYYTSPFFFSGGFCYGRHWHDNDHWYRRSSRSTYDRYDYRGPRFRDGDRDFDRPVRPDVRTPSVRDSRQPTIVANPRRDLPRTDIREPLRPVRPDSSFAARDSDSGIRPANRVTTPRTVTPVRPDSSRETPDRVARRDPGTSRTAQRPQVETPRRLEPAREWTQKADPTPRPVYPQRRVDPPPQRRVDPPPQRRVDPPPTRSEPRREAPVVRESPRGDSFRSSRSESPAPRASSRGSDDRGGGGGRGRR